MTDDFDARLRRDLRSTALPSAPAHLRERLREIAASGESRDAGGGSTRRRSRSRVLLAIAAVLLIGALVVFGATIGRRSPTTVDGLPVITVSEAIAAHATGGLPGGRAAIRGYWSNGSIGHSCAPPGEGQTPGELELYCHDGEWGITELDEQAFVVDQFGYVTYEASGPHLTPFIPSGLDGAEGLFSQPRINGQPYPPVPIVVVGHFDDPRAAQCRPAKRQLCLDRLVLDRIVEFDIGSVATPGVTPTPTPFPDPPPPALFEADRCAGDTEYAFVGWTSEAELGVDRGNPGHVWAMVTKNVVQRTDGWQDDPNDSGHTFQAWGRLICWAAENPHGEDAVNLETQPGSGYILWDDGLKVTSDDLVPRPAAT